MPLHSSLATEQDYLKKKKRERDMREKESDVLDKVVVEGLSEEVMVEVSPQEVRQGAPLISGGRGL